ncbi:uncharacterized protein MYCFIDRAFT_46883 [Pseudocercospora fijiensis CIRAD86]|uniref:Pre-rRNA-processing protein TSR2 n=1 Tax=Pseudocercospora fijiensis (strain CIRAD86) TaxID=383855 RepID=M3AID0_PSEFD|nr:uncharacterized protein MYCFIDRAFT_46883 [Pseudocercospora fijiensis CIRAD86]EME76963.1 hypothetical protein MYCFIDRAFT_46883 [Pseudocercospora fijiensis CIRAD86]
MAAPAQNGPVPAGAPAKATEAQLITAFDNSIWYLLDLWQPLSIAVDNGWGGGNSSDKRDWFAGAVSDFLNQPQYINPAPGAVLTFADMQEDLEVFLLQIMQDEFDCNIEDESEVELANGILRVRKAMTETLSTAAADEVKQRWENRGSKKHEKIVVQETNQEVGDDEEWDGFDEDEDMDEAPQLLQAPAQPREKPIPEVDEDGFTKVPSKKKR